MSRAHEPLALEKAAFPYLSQTCWCYDCDCAAVALLPENDSRRIARRMNLCSTCGNKRCPRSTWHEYDCTGSNEVGQTGSMYGVPGDPLPPNIPLVDEAVAKDIERRLAEIRNLAAELRRQAR